MKAIRRERARTIHCPTWREIAHSAWPCISAGSIRPQTKASSSKIERWRKQLGTFPPTRATERAQREGQP